MNTEEYFELDKRNVKDRFKGLPNQEITEKLRLHSNNFIVAAYNIIGGLNFGTIVRTANNFGANEVMYIGRRKWDRRGAVGTHLYTPLTHFHDEDSFASYIRDNQIYLATLECTDSAIDINHFNWPINKTICILVGEEAKGVSDTLLSISNVVLKIPSFGSIRSINVGVAAGIGMASLIQAKVGNYNET